MNINASDNKTFSIALGLTILFALIILFYGLGSIPLMSFNEARRAIPVEGMFNNSNLLLPYLNGEIYIDKPPLFYWCGWIISKIVGSVNEWSVRLTSAIAAAAIMMHVAFVIRKLQTRWVVLLTMLVLLTCTNFVTFARRSEIEMLLTFLCTASLLYAFDYICLNGKQASLYLSYLFMGFAILCKGPVPLLFVQVPIMVMAFKTPKARQYLKSIVGWLLLVVIGGSWYAIVTAKMGTDIWQKVFQVDIKEKVAGAKGDPIYDYAVYILADFVPWSLILLLTPLKTIKQWWSNDNTRFFLISVIVPFVCLSLFANKHAKYFLSAYPALAILVTFALSDRFKEWHSKWQRAFLIVLILLPLGYAVYFAFFERMIFEYRFYALNQLKEVSTQFEHSPMVSYKNIDMRSVYYYGKPIRIVQKEELQTLATQEPTLLLLEKDKFLKEVDITGWQTIEIIKPYLSNDQSAVLLGNAAFIKKFPQKE